MPSRQERRKAERDAAKRAPAQARASGAAGAAGAAGAGATGAAGAAAARANVILNPGISVGDWTTQAGPIRAAEMFRALGAETVKRRAGEGDSEAQWRLGRGLHSFPFQLNLSSSVHRITQLNSLVCPGVAHVER
jgi:hypothetical protein